MDIDKIKREMLNIQETADVKLNNAGAGICFAVNYLASRGLLGGAPDGYVLVPKEPTPHMLEQSNLGAGMRHKYMAMIAAAQKNEV